MKKSKQSITKSSKKKLNKILTDKLLKFLFYHQKLLVNINLDSEWKNQTSISEKQYKRLGKAYEFNKNEYKRIKKEKPEVI